MITQGSIAPLSARRQMMEEPSLGAGSFLDHALALNPNREVPYVYRHYTDHRGEVVLKGYSLNDLDRIRRKYAMWYQSNGVRPKDPVGICVGEGIEPLFHFLALSSLGAIPAMINDAMPAPSAKRYLDHIGAVGVVCDDPTALVAAYRKELGRRPNFIVPASELHAFEAGSGELPEQYPYKHDPDDVVALIHSSGTTGMPKSTMLSHRQFWRGKESRMVRFPAEPNDRLMCLMPHSHAGGLSYFMTATLLGLPMVAMAGWRRTVVEPVMKVFKPTMIASFPRTFVELALGDLPVEGAAHIHTWYNTGDSAHYGHIRRLVTLGKRPAGLVRPWLLPESDEEQPEMQGSQFLDGLGSSEMGMALFGQPYTPESPRNDRCIGKPLAIVEKAAILDESGKEVPDGTVGLLAVKSESRTKGYWHSPEMTKRFESNGFWLTGDVASRDSEGRFYHLDRTVDVIDTVNGPIYSLPMEEILLADCSEVIADGVVVGVAGDGGQQPIAIVQLQAGIEEPTNGALLELANSALTSAGKTPLAAIRVARTPDDYPTGVTGKVLKRVLRTRFATILKEDKP